MLLNSLVLPNGIWQMQLFQINQSEDSSKITIMYDNPSGQLHQRSITSAFNYNRTYSTSSMYMCHKTCLGFIKSTQYEEDICAEALGDLPLVAEEAGQAVYQKAVWQKLSNAKQGQQPLET